MNILITGGLGFIGSSLAIQEVREGNNVTIVDALIPQYGGNQFNIEPIKNDVEVIIGDVRNRTLIQKIVPHKDVIYSLAGTLSHVDSMTDPFTDLEVNCVSQLALLETCKKYNSMAKLLFAGTRNQYGRAKYLPVDEQHPMEPVDVNGINNIAAEWYYRLYHDIHGLWTCSLRLTNTFGPRHQMKHSRQGVLNWFIRQIIDNEKITLYGTGKQIRDVNYVDDVVSAFMSTARSEKANGRVFNLGGTPISLKDFVQKVISVNGKGNYSIKPFPPERKTIEIGDYIADWKAIHKTLGWKPIVRLEDGIQKTLQYYQQYKRQYWKS